MSSLPRKTRLYLTAGLVFAAVLTFAVYLPSLNNGFVDWDDSAYVYANANIRSLGPAFWKYALTAVTVSNWQPLTVVSYAIDYSIWGLNPFGYHLVNSVLHAMNTALAGVVAALLFSINARKGASEEARAGEGTDRGLLYASVVTALLFGLHPVRVESVAWVSERKDVLCGFFYLLSVISYIGYARSARRTGLYAASLGFFVLALLSKPMAVSLPLVLFVLDIYLERPGKLKTVVLEKVPFLALSAVMALITVRAQGHAVITADLVPMKMRLVNGAGSFVFYLYKTFWPADLVPYYPLVQAKVLSLEFAGALAFLGAVTAFSIIVFKKNRGILCLWLYYVVTLVPVSGIVQVGKQAAADRYAYLPGLAPILLVALGAGYLVNKHGRRTIFPAAVLSAAAVAVVLSVLTVRQTGVWKDTVTLWSREIESYPIVLAYLNRGVEYYRLGRFKEAADDFTVLVESGGPAPELAESYRYRGLTYQKMDENSLAIRDLSESIRLNPASPAAYNDRGNSYAETGYYKNAVEDLQTAIRLDPGNHIFYYNIGIAYLKAGERDLGLSNIRKAAGLGDEKARAYLSSGGG